MYLYVSIYVYKQAWANYVPDANTFCLAKKKKKTLEIHLFSRIGKPMKKLQLISNTTMNTSYLNILIMFTYLLMDWETFN